jgi:hypothetical protein
MRKRVMKRKMPAKGKQERSRKGPAQLDGKKKVRADARKAGQRIRQHEEDRPDRGGPQGRKDKDYQRKF